MKRILPYILILTVVLQLFAPFSVGIDKKNNLAVVSNKAEAVEGWDGTLSGYKNAFPGSSVVQQSSTYSEGDVVIDNWTVTIDTGVPVDQNMPSLFHWEHVKPEASWTANALRNAFTFASVAGSNYSQFEKDGAFVLKIKENNTGKTGFIDISQKILIGNEYKRWTKEGEVGMVNKIVQPFSISNNIEPSGQNGLALLSPGTKYDVSLYYLAGLSYGEEGVQDKGEVIPGLEENGANYIQIANTSITTASKENAIITTMVVPEATQGAGAMDTGDILPVCFVWFEGIKLGGCIAQGIYYLFFKTSSFVFGLAGKALDFTLMYSISDSSYRSGFVVEGWGIVRDFCNMFFIFVLLYIAFATMLNLNGVKTKEMIITVVVVGLLMNFSLFATQVIIDTSNILTRVFYNQKTIIAGEEKTDSAGNKLPTVSELGRFKEIKLSEAIVSKVNPQTLILQASKVGDIPVKGTLSTDTEEANKGGVTTTTFIIVTLLATAVNVVGIMAFLSVALIFIGRVVMLWMAMILSPLVFFSYTVPALGNLSMIGHKKWWPETLGMAFVAPVFAFFMYLIVQFLDKGLGLVNGKLGVGSILNDTAGSLDFVIAIVVPFAFIMVLLMKAKTVAVSMSGEVGAALSKAGSAVGGLALGAATGGAAMLGRASIGKLGDKLDKSTWVNKLAGGNNLFSKFAGNKLKDIGQGVSKSSFDVRATKLGGMAGKGMDIDMGKAKEGGYTKDRKDKVERKQKRAKEIEVNEDEELTQKVNKLEMDLQSLLRDNSDTLDTLDKRIVSAREESNDLSAKQRLDPRGLSTVSNGMGGFLDNKGAAKKAADALAELKGHKKAIKKGDLSYTITSLTDNTLDPGDTTIKYVTEDGTAGGRQTNLNAGGKSINKLEIEDIPHAKHAKLTESRRRTTNYANNTAWWGGEANKEAQHKIIMGTKLDSGTKT